MKTVSPEDLIGLKVQAIHNDPVNRFLIDSADIRQILARHKDSLDMGLVREHFKVFHRKACWMSGSEILSEAEREEMLQDSLQECRGKAFLAARLRSQSGSLDDSIEFLSRHAGLFPFTPRRTLTDDFRL